MRTGDPTPEIAALSTGMQLRGLLETMCADHAELGKLLNWVGGALEGKPQRCLVLQGWPRCGMCWFMQLAKILLGSEALIVYDELNDELKAGRWAADDALPNVLVRTTCQDLPEGLLANGTIVRCRRPAKKPADDSIFLLFDAPMNAARADEQCHAKLCAVVRRLAQA